MRFAFFVAMLGIGLGLLLPPETQAQQVLVDDPTSVAPGAAQLEAWHSREESWIAPALRLHPRVEVAGGAVGSEGQTWVTLGFTFMSAPLY